MMNEEPKKSLLHQDSDRSTSTETDYGKEIDMDVAGKEKHRRNRDYNRAHVENIQKYDLEKENADLIQLYDRAKAGGKEEWETYALAMCSKLEKFIRNHIRIHHFSYGTVEQEDLMSSGILAILEKLPAYDPRQSMPSSFFGAKIDELLKKCNHSEAIMSDHYLSMKGKLDQVARDAGFADCLDPALTPEVLHILSGISLSTVVNTLNQADRKKESLDDPDQKQVADEWSKSPEQLAIQNENLKILKDAFDSLSSYEQFIFSKACLETELDSKGKERHWSIRRLCTYLADPDVMQHFGLRKAPSGNQVSRDIELARKKLANYNNLRDQFTYLPKKSPQPYDVYEQATEDEIESMIFEEIKIIT